MLKTVKVLDACCWRWDYEYIDYMYKQSKDTYKTSLILLITCLKLLLVVCIWLHALLQGPWHLFS